MKIEPESQTPALIMQQPTEIISPIAKPRSGDTMVYRAAVLRIENHFMRLHMVCLCLLTPKGCNSKARSRSLRAHSGKHGMSSSNPEGSCTSFATKTVQPLQG